MLPILAACWPFALALALGAVLGLLGGAFMARHDLRAYASELARYRTEFGFLDSDGDTPAVGIPAPSHLEGR